MRKILNTEFEANGVKCLVTSNRKRSEYEGDYKLCSWNDHLGAWIERATDDGIRFLKKYAEENAIHWR